MVSEMTDQRNNLVTIINGSLPISSLIPSHGSKRCSWMIGFLMSKHVFCDFMILIMLEDHKG